MELTNIAGDSLSSLNCRAENLLVIGELEDLIGKSLTSIESWVGTVGLITILGSKVSSDPLNLELNFNMNLRGSPEWYFVNWVS